MVTRSHAHEMMLDDLTTGLMISACLSFLRKAYRFHADCDARIARFEHNATPAQIAQLYRTIKSIENL